jgi:hypothetical protein
MKPDCVAFDGYVHADGYGRAHYKGQRVQAHRLAFFEANGFWPKVCRHTCDYRACVNPDHLVDGTYADNTKDMMERGRQFAPNRGKTHCKRGHEFTPENIYWSGPDRQWRSCYTCKRELGNRRLPVP